MSEALPQTDEYVRKGGKGLRLFSQALIVMLCMVCGAFGADSYYESPGTFSLRPDPNKLLTKITGFGPVGISIDLVKPNFTMRIAGIEKGSPADATGTLKQGQFILSINGNRLADIDPRIQLGHIISQAEATDGKVRLMVADAPDGKPRELVVLLPVLGEYASTWPLNCTKSEQIVRNHAEYLKREGSNKGFASMGMLFLLSTGEESDLAYVKHWARAHNGDLRYPWHIGYGGLALCEYYLRTGDEQVMPAIQKIADHAIQMENFGGWGGRSAFAGVNYGGGGGHVNAAGSLVPAFVFLAKECGATIPDDALRRIARHWVRWSGRGNVAYGNARPESGFTDNGRNGKLAFSMAAAAALTPEGEDSIYAKARDTSASYSFYSTSYMLHGHTGGGIGEVNRSTAMGLLHKKMPNHYRSFMNERRWHYELSRRWNGAFAILGGERYDNTEWGTGYAMTYTVPRQTLRLTGAAPTQYSHLYPLPELPWGTDEDQDFQSIRPVAYPDGSLPDISQQTVAQDTAYPLFRRLREGKVDAEGLEQLVRSPCYNLRSSMAVRYVANQPPAAVLLLLGSDDARLRRTALESVLKAPDKLLTPEIRARVVAMLVDPKESWYVKDAALQLVGRAEKEWIVSQVDRILPYLDHEEWWLQRSALNALAPVIDDSRCVDRVMPALAQLLQTNHLYNVIVPLRWGNPINVLKKANPGIQAAALEMFKTAYANYQSFQHEVDSVEKKVNEGNRDVFVDAMIALPGGYNALYTAAKKRHPGQVLPYRKRFLAADPKDLGPELKAEVNKIIQRELIPAHIEQYHEKLNKQAASEAVGHSDPMGDLVYLYKRMGVHEHDWQNVEPSRNRMTWWYHSFDPPEKWEEVSDRLGRYRKVTFPEGMEGWYSTNFDPAKADWQRGLAPIGAADGKKGHIGPKRGCTLSFCGCDEPINTLWEKDVLMIRGTFKFPPLEKGYRYRLLHVGISHVGLGGGYRIYVNGKLFHEQKTGVDRRGGSRPEGKVITKEWWSDFASGEVDLAAITFKKHHPRNKKYGGNIAISMQRMKVPPLKEEWTP